jgi:diaminopimelate epimerase
MGDMRFWKMEGCGNDFVVAYRHDLPADFGPELPIAVCEHRRGVGADGLLVVDRGPSLSEADAAAGATARMTLYNADGSIAETCGNGLRCVVRRLSEDGAWPADGRGTIATLAGPSASLLDGEAIEVGLGAPRSIDPEPIVVEVAGLSLRGTRVDMGNPHFVVFEDDHAGGLPDLTSWGPAVERDPLFPDRTNVEWVRLVRGQLFVRVWERGVGETLACGSGACAAAVAARVTGRTDVDRVALTLPGGPLSVDWSGSARDRVTLRGPARTVFSGSWRFEG